MKIEKIHIAILFCFVFLLHFENWDVLGTAEFLTITKVFGYLYFAFAFRDVERFFSFAKLKAFLIPILLFFALLTVISLIHYDELYHLYVHVFDFSIFQCIILFWVMSNHLQNDQKTANQALLFYVAGAVVTGALFYLGIGVTMVEDRLSIFGEDQNSIGIRMTMAVLILLSIIFENHLKLGIYRFFLLFALPFLLPVIALTGSRTALLCLAIGLLIFIIFIKMGKVMKTGFVILATAGVFLLVGYFAKFDTIQQRLTNSIENGDNAGRTNIWNHIIPIFYESPVVGVGTTGYAKRVIPLFGIRDNNNVRNPHNLYLEILCYTGVVGLALFMLFFVRLFIKSIRLYRHINYIIPSILLVIMMVYMFSGGGLVNKIFWYLYAFVVALPLYNSTESAEKQTEDTC